MSKKLPRTALTELSFSSLNSLLLFVSRDPLAGRAPGPRPSPAPVGRLWLTERAGWQNGCRVCRSAGSSPPPRRHWRSRLASAALRQHQVHDDGSDAAGADGVLHQHVDPRRQHLEHVRVVGDTKPKTQEVATIRVSRRSKPWLMMMRPPAMAIMENMMTMAPPSRGWDGGEEASHNREEPQQHQDDGDELAHVARGHPGHLDDAVVLGEGGERQEPSAEAITDTRPSASTPPESRFWNSGPWICRWETMAVAVMSPPPPARSTDRWCRPARRRADRRKNRT